MSFFIPTLSITEAWEKTLSSWATIFRQTRFATEDTFSWKTFEIGTISAGTMTIATSSIIVYRATYVKLKNMLWVTFVLQCTLGGVATNQINIDIPWTASSMSEGIPSAFDQQRNIVYVNNAGVLSPALLTYNAGSSIWNFRLLSLANFTLGGLFIQFTMVFDVKA